MTFFQNSVLNKHLKAQDTSSIKAAYKKFIAHFHDPAIQENIRRSKEEQYQGEFLIDLFVNVLGYTKKPNPWYNLTTEYKNVKDSKKADGAVLINGIVKAVIELKETETTDLNRIEAKSFWILRQILRTKNNVSGFSGKTMFHLWWNWIVL